MCAAKCHTVPTSGSDSGLPLSLRRLQRRTVLLWAGWRCSEIVWDKKASSTPKVVFGSPDWQSVRALRKPVSIVMRIADHAGPFAEADEKTAFIAAQAAELLRRVRSEGVSCEEFQLDFDCAQKKLMETKN